MGYATCIHGNPMYMWKSTVSMLRISIASLCSKFVHDIVHVCSVSEFPLMAGLIHNTSLTAATIPAAKYHSLRTKK